VCRDCGQIPLGTHRFVQFILYLYELLECLLCESHVTDETCHQELSDGLDAFVDDDSGVVFGVMNSNYVFKVTLIAVRFVVGFVFAFLVRSFYFCFWAVRLDVINYLFGATLINQF
jgi:hypothetical protein